MKNIMVLAGGNDQIELINCLRRKNKNAYIFLVDYFDAPVAKDYADEHIKISTLDKEQVLSAAIRENIDFIITACTDQALLTMAYVSERLGLQCYLNYCQASMLTNKRLMKLEMFQNNILTSNFFIIKNSNELECHSLRYPLVVKPVDSNSSKGISKVLSAYELEAAYNTALELSGTGEAIIEEYIEGIEYSVDAAVCEYEAEVLLITETKKLKTNKNKFTITQSYYNPYNHRRLYQRVKAIIQAITNIYKIRNTPFILQLLETKDGKVYVIEFSARTGGGSKIHIIRKLTGVDMIEFLLSPSVCNKIALKVFPEYASFLYVYVRSGTVIRISGLDAIEKIGCSYYMYKEIGAQISKAENSSDRIMGIFITARTEKELKQKIKIIDESVRVYNEENKDIMIHGVY